MAMDVFAGVLPLVTVADTGSFRRAARTLGVTPSAVSKAVARLEAELGVHLIHRTSRAMTLTTEGEDVVAGFRDALDRVRATRDAAADAQRTAIGRLRVTWPFSLARLFAAQVIPKMAARFPQVQVSSLITDRQVDLAAENIDVAIRIGALADSNLVVRRIGAIRWITAASPAYLARRGTPAHPRDLDRHASLRFLLPSGRLKEWVFRDADEILEIMPAPESFIADHGETLVMAALAGVGIIQAHDVMVRDHIKSGALIKLLGNYEAPGPAIHALRRAARAAPPKSRAFLAIVDECITASQA